MSVLVGSKLLDRLNDPNPEKRLVVGPILEPTEQITASQASIDVRLGCDFRLAAASNIGVLDEFADSPANHFADLARVYHHLYVPLGDSVTIHPHQLILGLTLEYIRLPGDLMAYVVGRSSFGRLGLIIATAIGVHPHFFGALTLELRNLGEAPVRLYPGQTIAQLFFHVLDPAERDNPLWPDVKEKVGQYTPAKDFIPGRLSTGTTTSHLAERRRAQMKYLRKMSGDFSE
jgi:dCTP deaminase